MTKKNPQQLAIEILLTPNHPDNPQLTHEGAGILPAQTRWILARLGYAKQNWGLGDISYDWAYSSLVKATILAGFTYTHEDLDPKE